MSQFGAYTDSPKPSSFFGQSGWWTVPGGRSWHMLMDSNLQMWASPEPLTKNEDGSVSETAGAKKYACELAPDFTYVFQDELANRKLNIDSPAPDRLSQLI